MHKHAEKIQELMREIEELSGCQVVLIGRQWIQFPEQRCRALDSPLPPTTPGRNEREESAASEQDERQADGSKILTVKQFAKKYPAFTEASLRHLIFQSKTRYSSRGPIQGNGFDSALLRVGSRVLINEKGFFDWLERNNAGETE